MRIAEDVGKDSPFQVITGVSAGGINAAALAGHRGSFRHATRDLCAAWLRLSTDKVFKANFTSLTESGLQWLWTLLTGGITLGFEVQGLLDTAPLCRYLSKRLDMEGIQANLSAGRLKALGLTATSYSTGETVTFVHGRPDSTLWQRAGRRAVRATIRLDHVMASAALPLVFPAVRIANDFYGDGSIRQTSPLAPAVHLGAGRLLTISARYPRTEAEKAERQVSGYPPPAQILGMLMHSVFLDALENDAERLERINRTLTLLPPETSHPEGLRPIRLLVLRPSRDLGKLSVGLLKHLPRPVRILTRGLGASRTTTPDFLSYLLFERSFIERLIELGYQDAYARRDEIARFLEE